MELILTDWIILGLVVLSALCGLARGLVREIFSIAGWAIAALVTYFAYTPVHTWLSTWLESGWLLDALTIGGLFIVTLIAFAIISHRINMAVRDSALGGVDRGLGFIFGLGRGWLIVVAAFYGISAAYGSNPLPEWVTKAASRPLAEITLEQCLAWLGYDTKDNLFINLTPPEPMPATNTDKPPTTIPDTTEPFDGYDPASRDELNRLLEKNP